MYMVPVAVEVTAQQEALPGRAREVLEQHGLLTAPQMVAVVALHLMQVVVIPAVLVEVGVLIVPARALPVVLILVAVAVVMETLAVAEAGVVV